MIYYWCKMFEFKSTKFDQLNQLSCLLIESFWSVGLNLLICEASRLIYVLGMRTPSVFHHLPAQNGTKIIPVCLITFIVPDVIDYSLVNWRLLDWIDRSMDWSILFDGLFDKTDRLLDWFAWSQQYW